MNADARLVPPIFSASPRIERVDLADGTPVYVVDDVLRDPAALVDWAIAEQAAFQRVDFNAYPGTYRMTPATVESALSDFFAHHIRPRFDARRLQQMHCRLSMVTMPPEALRPYQWLCHTDRQGLDANQSIQASVLYLFDRPALGGTSFYVPKRPPAEIAQLFADTMALSNEAFSMRYDIAPGYITQSNAYFERIGGVEAKWNRMIFYDGSLLHSGDIHDASLLTHDPSTGRLTFNGFFVSRRHAA